jgi:hypothetical protein
VQITSSNKQTFTLKASLKSWLFYNNFHLIKTPALQANIYAAFRALFFARMLKSPKQHIYMVILVVI